MGKSPLRAHFLGLRAHCAETLRAFPVGAERRPATRAIHYGFFRVCSCGGEPRARATTPVNLERRARRFARTSVVIARVSQRLSASSPALPPLVCTGPCSGSNAK